MSLRGDERGAAVQVGAVILFGFVVVALASWQAQVVPQQNADVEYTHSQRVQDDMQDVRNGVVSAPGGNRPSSVGVEMGTSYPPRTLFVNPSDPGGTVRTVGTENASVNVTLSNAAVGNDDARQLWGTEQSFDTGGLAYSPRYNVYTGAPDTVYENSVLYNEFDDGTSIVVADQDVVDGRRLSLVTLGGELDRTQGGTYTVDLDAVSSSSNRVSVTNDSAGTLNVSFATQRSAGFWEDRLSDELTTNGGNVVDVVASGSVGPFTVVTVQLQGGVTYDLQMARVAVGQNGSDTTAGYLTDPNGDSIAVGEGSTGRVVVEVRDRYNNPVSGVLVNASVESGPGSLADRNLTTGDDGRVAFEYSAPQDGDSTDETARVDVSYTVDPANTAVDTSAPENLSVSVVVDDDDGGGGGGGAYSIDWQDPDSDNPSGPLSDCDDESCTWDVGADSDSDLNLRSVTSPTVEGLDVDFRVNNSTVGTLGTTDTTTGSNGEATTVLTANENGSVGVFVITPDSSDLIAIEVTNVSGGGGGGDTASPTVTDAIISNTPINESDTGTTQTVTVTFNESMDTSVDPTVEITGLASSPYSVSGSYADSTTWTGTVTLNDDDEEATATIEVSGAQDDAGNTQSPNPDTSNTFQVDTLAPSITNFAATNPSGTTIEVSFDSSESLSDIAVDIRDDTGTTLTTLTEGDFSVSGSTYTATYDPGSPGEYSANLTLAEDAVGNDGASGESDVVVVDNTAPNFDTLNATAVSTDGTTGGGGNDVEAVDVGYTTSDNLEVDRVRFVVLDNDGNVVANVTRTVTDDSNYRITLGSSVKVNGNNDVTVNAYVYDRADNYQRCDGNIQDRGNTIRKADGDFTCSTTTT